jgi:hypothetical protein
VNHAQPIVTVINPDDLWIRRRRGDVHRSRASAITYRFACLRARRDGVVFFRA